MKRMRLLVLVAACALVGGLAEAQGLGEAAAREKQRREQAQKKSGAAKVITTEELGKTAADGPHGPLAQDAQRPQDTSAGERQHTVKEGTDEIVEAPGEAQWRQRAKEAKQEIEDAEKRIQDLQAKASELFGRIQASTDTNELLRLRAEQQELTKRVEEAQIVLGTVRKEQQDLVDEARRASVPPGWLR